MTQLTYRALKSALIKFKSFPCAHAKINYMTGQKESLKNFRQLKLFILEVLDIAMRNENEIKGIRIEKEETNCHYLQKI